MLYKGWHGQAYLSVLFTEFLDSVKLVGGEGVEPSPPCGEGILSPSCLPFHHPPIQIQKMEAAQGFEPWITDLQSAALVHLAMPPHMMFTS